MNKTQRNNDDSKLILKKKASDVNIYFFGKKKYTPFLILANNTNKVGLYSSTREKWKASGAFGFYLSIDLSSSI